MLPGNTFTRDVLNFVDLMSMPTAKAIAAFLFIGIPELTGCNIHSPETGVISVSIHPFTEELYRKAKFILDHVCPVWTKQTVVALPADWQGPA
jgi:hypothetical protein